MSLTVSLAISGGIDHHTVTVYGREVRVEFNLRIPNGPHTRDFQFDATKIAKKVVMLCVALERTQFEYISVYLDANRSLQQCGGLREMLRAEFPLTAEQK